VRARPHQRYLDSFSFSPLHSHPWAGDPAVSAPGATARWMQGSARKDEFAPLAPRRVHHQALSPGSHCSLDVAEVFLERTDRQPKLVAEIIKAPLPCAQELDNLLPTGSFGRHRGSITAL
jgi:hypothetical protein